MAFSGLPSYQISVISCTTGETLKIIDPLSFYSLQYSRKLNDVGVCVLVMPSSVDNYALFGWDNFIEIYRTSPVTGLLIREATYFTRSKHRFREGNEERLVVGGVSLEHLMMRRVINPAADPASTDGYSRKAAAADVVMAAYVNEQGGSLASAARQFPDFTVDPVSGTGANVDENARYDNLFNKLAKIARDSGMDFKIERQTGTTLLMTIARIGADRTQSTNYPYAGWVGLNPARGNMSSPSLQIDRTEERNYVYTLGQGQAQERRVYEAGTSYTSLSPYNRCEFSKDARNVSQTDDAALQQAALAALSEEQVVTEFEFTPTGIEAGSIYRLNWDIGDNITAIWEDFTQNLRVTGVEINLSDQDETISVTVGNQYDAGAS